MIFGIPMPLTSTLRTLARSCRHDQAQHSEGEEGNACGGEGDFPAGIDAGVAGIHGDDGFADDLFFVDVEPLAHAIEVLALHAGSDFAKFGVNGTRADGEDVDSEFFELDA